MKARKARRAEKTAEQVVRKESKRQERLTKASDRHNLKMTRFQEKEEKERLLSMREERKKLREERRTLAAQRRRVEQDSEHRDEHFEEHGVLAPEPEVTPVTPSHLMLPAPDHPIEDEYVAPPYSGVLAPKKKTRGVKAFLKKGVEDIKVVAKEAAVKAKQKMSDRLRKTQAAHDVVKMEHSDLPEPKEDEGILG